MSSHLLAALGLLLMLGLFGCDRASAPHPKTLTPSTKLIAPKPWSPPGALTYSPTPLTDDSPIAYGDIIGALSGPGLSAPLPLPLMMRFDDPSDERCQLEPPQVQALWLPGRRILVIEQHVLCGSPVCKIWDVDAKVWGQDERCPEGPTAQFMLTHMSDDVFFLYGYTEGPGEGMVIRWQQGSAQQTLLAHISSPQDPVKTPKGWLLESVCDPASGRVAVVVDSEEAQCQPDDGCGYCVMTYGQPVRWLWQPGLPPQQLSD